MGLGAKDGEFGQVFKDVFREICLQDGDPQTVVSRYATNLQSVLDAAPVPCWAPDPAGSPCKVG